MPAARNQRPPTPLFSFHHQQQEMLAVPRLLLPPSLLCTISNPQPLSLLITTTSRRITALSQSRQHAAAIPSESAVRDFWQWLSSEGVANSSSSPPPVKPEFVPEGLGLVAQRDVTKNEVVVEIPKKIWINPDTVSASDIGRVCGGLKPWVAIALFLLREKALGSASSWRPYLDILPRATDSPIFW